MKNKNSKNYERYLQYKYTDKLGATNKIIKDVGCTLCSICALVYNKYNKQVDVPTINFLFYLHDVYVNWAGVSKRKNSYLVSWYKIKKVFPNLKVRHLDLYNKNKKNRKIPKEFINKDSIVSVDVTKLDERYDSHWLVVLNKKDGKIDKVFDSSLRDIGIRDFVDYKKNKNEKDAETIKSIVNLGF